MPREIQQTEPLHSALILQRIQAFKNPGDDHQEPFYPPIEDPQARIDVLGDVEKDLIRARHKKEENREDPQFLDEVAAFARGQLRLDTPMVSGDAQLQGKHRHANAVAIRNLLEIGTPKAGLALAGVVSNTVSFCEESRSDALDAADLIQSRLMGEGKMLESIAVGTKIQTSLAVADRVKQS